MKLALPAAVRRAAARTAAWPPVGFALAVVRRFREDEAATRANALAYAAFLSLFPLLLLASSVAGFLLAGHPALETQWTTRAAAAIPAVGDLIAGTLHAAVRTRTGAGIAGSISLLLAGRGVVLAAGQALDRIFRLEGLAGIKAQAWAVGSLLGLGAAAAASIGVTVAGGALAGTVGALVAGFGADVLLFLAAYFILSRGRRGTFWGMWPGALVAAGGWTVLKEAGVWFAASVVARSHAAFGSFAATAGILVVLSIECRLFLYGAETVVIAGARKSHSRHASTMGPRERERGAAHDMRRRAT